MTHKEGQRQIVTQSSIVINLISSVKLVKIQEYNI